MSFTDIWLNLFGTAAGWFGVNIGFWVGMGICAAIVLVMNLICWLMPPRRDRETDRTGHPVNGKFRAAAVINTAAAAGPKNR